MVTTSAEPRTPTSRVHWMDFARGVSILLVVIFHACIALDSVTAVPDLYWKFNRLVTPLRMPVFFLVAGMLAASQLGRSWKDILTGRVLTLVYVLALWSIAQIVLGPVLTETTWAQAWTELASFVVLPRSVLWFLWALIIYLVIARSFRARPIALLAVSSAIACVGFNLDERTLPFSYLGTLRFALFFFVGIFFASQIKAWADRPRPFTAAALGLFFVVLFLLTYKELVPPMAFGTVRLARSLVGATFMVVASVLVCRVYWIRAVPTWLGKRTLEIYVAHSLAISLILTLTGSLNLDPLQIVLPLVLSLAAVAVSLGLRIVAERAGAYWMYAPPTPLRQWLQKRWTDRPNSVGRESERR